VLNRLGKDGAVAVEILYKKPEEFGIFLRQFDGLFIGFFEVVIETSGKPLGFLDEKVAVEVERSRFADCNLYDWG